jgi:hypothetical protein
MPQFKNLPEPPPHQFVVFSIMGDDDKLIVKYAQCNNCGRIHKVIDVCKSEVTGREAFSSVMTIDDVKASLPANLANILDVNGADLPTWEAAQFIYENKRWGEFVVLATDVEEGTRQGKYVQILGENLFKVNAFSREEYAR